jgi:hypothetical protein
VRARLRARQQDEIKIGQWSAPLGQPHHGEKMTVRMTVSLIATEGYNCHVQCHNPFQNLREHIETRDVAMINHMSGQPDEDALLKIDDLASGTSLPPQIMRIRLSNSMSSMGF